MRRVVAGAAMKLRRILLLGAAFFLVLLKFAIDVVAKNVALGIGGLGLVREAITVAVFGILMVVIHSLFPRGDVNPVRRLGLLLGGTLVTLVGVIALGLLPADGFDAKELSLMPLDYPTLFVASLASILLGVFSLMALRSLRDMVLLLRRKGTERNYLIFVGLILATALSTLLYRPLENGLVTTILFVLAVLFAVMTSFRLPWIVYLSKREKIVNLVFSFFLFFLLLGLNVYLRESPVLSRAIIYYSRPLAQFVVLALMFATVYAGMAFVSTLFHLPTAEAFDRKRSEISSVHTLSKLVTQVLDFDELVETVTSMTLQVCEAHSCWLEIQQSSEESPAAGAARTYQLAGVKNIGPDQIDRLALDRCGLEHRTSPAGVERRPHHVQVIGRRRRGEQERVPQAHAAELDGQVTIVCDHETLL